MRILLIKDSEGEFKVEVPDEVGITFGPDIPYEDKQSAYGRKSYSLRIYSDSNKKGLLAVFAEVKWFRDLSIKHSRLIIREEGKSMWKSDEHGYEMTQSNKRSSEFVETAKLIGSGTTTKTKKNKRG